MARLPHDQTSLWRTYHRAGAFAPLNDDIETDVVVVGGGITGLTAAYMLKTRGLRVVVLEKDTVGSGTTGFTTGKVTSQHNLIYNKLVSNHGESAARIYGDANEAAIQMIATIIKKENIDCDFARDDNYVYSTDPKKRKEFEHEAQAATRLGLPATLESSTDLPFPVTAAVKFHNQAKLNAQKYVQGLAAVVHGDKGTVYEHSRAIWFTDGDTVSVSTPHGSVTAKHTVIATNVPTLPLVARGEYCLFEYPNTSYIVSAPYPAGLKGMYISPDSDHYSLLPISVDGETHLLIGGDSHLTGLSLGSKKHFENLAGYAEKHFQVSSLEHQWSARDYLSYDDIPLVGKLYPWSKHIWVATAMMKWGLTNSTVAATILTDGITGEENAWASVFATNRTKAPRSFPRAVVKETKKLF